jgi:hypothetical protein
MKRMGIAMMQTVWGRAVAEAMEKETTAAALATIREMMATIRETMAR